MQIRDHGIVVKGFAGTVKERRTFYCRYCGNSPANNKQGQWGRACSGCKGALTRMLRSGEYGPTYAKATKERLMGMVYDHLCAPGQCGAMAHRYGKWVDDADT